MGITEYYQIAYTTKDPATLKRELKPLQSINDHNIKDLLTLDDEPPLIYDGIRKMIVLDWLIASTKHLEASPRIRNNNNLHYSESGI